MSDAIAVEIAESVVVVLNDANLSQPFTAARSYLSIYDTSDMETLRVDVITATMAIERLDVATRHRFTYQTDIVFQKRVDAATDQIDPLMSVLEQVVDLFRNLRLPGTTYPRYECVGVEYRPYAAADWLDARGVFGAVVTLTHRIGRS